MASCEPPKSSSEDGRNAASTGSFDTAALEAAYRALASSLRTRLRRRLSHAADADEAVQEVFLRAWQARGREIHSLDGFLYGIADNVALERLRDRQRHGLPREAGEGAANLPDPATPEDQVAGSQIYDRIQKMLGELSPARSRAYRLYLEGTTQNQIAAALGVSRAMARKHIASALAQVQAIVDAPDVVTPPAVPMPSQHPGTRRGSILLWPPGTTPRPLRRAFRFLLRLVRRHDLPAAPG